MLDSQWSFQAWQLNEGLPNNFVVGTARTHDHYLWVATRTGLARFDGVRFEPVPTETFFNGPILGLRAISESRNGGLWLAMDPGIVVRLGFGRSQVFTNTMPGLVPMSLTEDNDGALWITYREGELRRLRDGQWTEFRPGEQLPARGSVCSVACDSRGQIWCAKGGTLSRFNGRFETVLQLNTKAATICRSQSGGLWICDGLDLIRLGEQGNTRVIGTRLPPFQNPAATVLTEDREGSVWIGTYENGLYRWNGSAFEPVATSDRQIDSIAEEADGSLWVGTGGGGLNRVRRLPIQLESDAGGVRLEAVRSMCEDPDGVIWAVSQSGELARRTSAGWSKVARPELRELACVTADQTGGVWIGTRTGSVHRLKGGKFTTWSRADGIIGRWISGLLVSRDGSLWIASEKPDGLQRLRDGRLESVTLNPEVHNVRAMAEDSETNLWIGARDAAGSGLVLRITHGIVTDETRRPNAPSRPIRCMYPAADGAIWIGSPGTNGLVRLKNGRFARITVAQGLYDSVISQIVADDRGWLWCAADRGLFKMRAHDLDEVADGKTAGAASIRYGPSVGLPALQGNAAASSGALRDAAGRLWIPMRSGLAVVDPKQLREDPQPPPVRIERITLDQSVLASYGGVMPVRGSVDLGKTKYLSLPPGNRRIEFEFTELGFGAPENERMRYRLDGFDEDWIDVTSERRAVYPRLSAGRYRFQVIACNGDGVWNEAGDRVALDVAPFVWQTWWFRLTTLALFTVLITAAVRYVSFRRLQMKVHMLKQETLLARERTRIARDLHDQFGNRLTELGLIAELEQRETASQSDLLPVIRSLEQDLDTIVWAVNPRNDTLDHLVDFIHRTTGQFLERSSIAARFELPDEVPAIPLTPELRHTIYLVAREAVGNVVKHSGASLVRIKIDLPREGWFDFRLTDNGRGFSISETAARGRHGLENMRARIEEFGGSFELDSRPGEQTVIHFRLPLQPAMPDDAGGMK
jgi:signal transduction histidine kinase/ligand-binding sensor domain-containing protein